MSSFRDARAVLFDSYDDGLIDEDEFVLLYDLNTSKNPVFPYENYDVFKLENVDEAECKAEFRVEKGDLPQLAEVLGIPREFRCDQRTVCDGMEGLCMLLRRLAYPCRYSDLIPRFGRPVPEISMITSTVADFIYVNHGYRITRWNNTILSPDNLERYAEAIHSKGAALDNCFGFVDGTVRPICRPNVNQRQVYNGHKRVHALKFQSVAIPNGIIANLYGPVGKYIFNLLHTCQYSFFISMHEVLIDVQWAVFNCHFQYFIVEGKRHDAAMLVDSGLLDSLQQHAYSTNNQPLCIYSMVILHIHNGYTCKHHIDMLK